MKRDALTFLFFLGVLLIPSCASYDDVFKQSKIDAAVWIQCDRSWQRCDD